MLYQSFKLWKNDTCSFQNLNFSSFLQNLIAIYTHKNILQYLIITSPLIGSQYVNLSTPMEQLEYICYILMAWQYLHYLFTLHKIECAKTKYNVPCIITYRNIIMILHVLYIRFKGHRRKAFFWLRQHDTHTGKIK